MFDKLFNRFGSSDDRQSALNAADRWVVLDTETTGLNLKRDHVISIAAVAIHLVPDLSQARIDLGDTFGAVLHQEQPTARKDNILIHHIGIAAQTEGKNPRDVLESFATWVGQSPLWAYHAPFDKAMLANAYKRVQLEPLANPWVDIQPLANWAARQTHMLGLDECMSIFDLSCIERHQAASDTFLTAELLLKLMPRLREVAHNFQQVQRLSSQNAMPHT